MFDWLRKSTPALEDFGFLGVDMHAHWLPGIDDGAKNMDESLEMLRHYAELGYSTLIATPHVMSDYYQNTPGIILGKLDEVRTAARKQNIDLQLFAAAEYLLDEGFEGHLDRDELLTLPDGHSVLVEFGFYALPMNLDGILFRLQTAGYEPVLAHPERYSYLRKKPGFLHGLWKKGVKLQVNLLSLSGHYGQSVQLVAKDLLDKGMIAYLGTDSHSVQHLEGVRDLLSDRKAIPLLQGSSFHNSQLLPA